MLLLSFQRVDDGLRNFEVGENLGSLQFNATKMTNHTIRFSPLRVDNKLGPYHEPTQRKWLRIIIVRSIVIKAITLNDIITNVVTWPGCFHCFASAG